MTLIKYGRLHPIPITLPNIPHHNARPSFLPIPNRRNHLIPMLEIALQILDDRLLEQQKLVFLLEFLLDELQAVLRAEGLDAFVKGVRVQSLTALGDVAADFVELA